MTAPNLQILSETEIEKEMENKIINQIDINLVVHFKRREKTGDGKRCPVNSIIAYNDTIITIQNLVIYQKRYCSYFGHYT